MPFKTFSELFEGRLPEKGLPFTIGWELEYGYSYFAANLESLKAATKKAIPAESSRPEWKDEHCGVECTSPVFSSPTKIGDYLAAFFQLVKSQNCDVTNLCGGHMHLGVNKFSSRNLSRFFIGVNLCQNFFFDMVPAYRQNNQFCRKVSPTSLQDYLKAVRLAAPLLLEGQKKYSEVVGKFPEACRPSSREVLTFPSNPGHWSYPRPYSPLQGLEFSPAVREALKPCYGLGLPMIVPSENNISPVRLGTLDGLNWIRHQNEFETLEFRLLPSTVDQEEWQGYLAVICWFAFKFKTEAEATLREILGRSDEELLAGALPFNDWPSPILDWLFSHKHIAKKNSQLLAADAPPNIIQPARAIA